MGRASRFTEEYKREAVRQAESSGNVRQTARNLGMSAAFFDYIEVFYNPQRLHSSLGFLSPSRFAA